MIKTFIGQDIAKLDEACNAFMRSMSQNKPVRTESFVLDGIIFHKNTVFWDEKFPKTAPEKSDEVIDDGETASEVEGVEKKKSSKLGAYPENVGALWDKGTRGITGKFKNEPIAMSEAVVARLRSGESVIITIKGLRTQVNPTKKKISEKSPDYFINMVE